MTKTYSFLTAFLFYTHVFSISLNQHNFHQYTPSEMREHKERFTHIMKTNPKNIHDKTYQMQRALKTVWGSDADYIPKMKGAGEIFTKNNLSYQLMHNGVKIHLNSYYDVQWLTDVIYGLKGHHEPQEEKCFYEVLKHIPNNATMIELGSYWAYYSLWFASEIPGAKNFLVEPDAYRLEIGKKNFELNNKSGHFTQAFVGVVRDPEPDMLGAPWLSISDFIEKHQIDHIHILHADIQSAEVEMLDSCVKYLDKIDYFFISTHRPQEDHLPCLAFFKKYDLIIVAQHSSLESCSGDGLIVAKRKGVPGPDYIEIKKYS